MDLSDRQKQLLAAIIEEFMKTAQAVGSIDLAEDYEFDISPATIRNEMAELARIGYLYKSYSSSGRIPTTLAWRLYLQEFLDEEDLSVVDEVKVREKLFQNRNTTDRLIIEGVCALAEFSGYAGIALLDQVTYHSGLANLLNYKEFQNLETFQKFLYIIEQPSLLKKIFASAKSIEDIYIVIGEELSIETMQNFAVVFSKVRMHGGNFAYFSVFGPNRMNYGKVIPAIRSISDTIHEAAIGW